MGGSPLPDTVTPLRLGVRRCNAEVSGELVGALQCSFTLFETGAMIPELIFKGRIALDSVPTAGAFFSLECIAELHHASSNTPRTWGGTLTLYQGYTHSYIDAIIYLYSFKINVFFSWYQNLYIYNTHSLSVVYSKHVRKIFF